MINEEKDNSKIDEAFNKINKQLDYSFNFGYKKGFEDGFEKGKEEGKRNAFWNSGSGGTSWNIDWWDVILFIFCIGIVYSSCFKN